jgi:hypothetical protein
MPLDLRVEFLQQRPKIAAVGRLNRPRVCIDLLLCYR